MLQSELGGHHNQIAAAAAHTWPESDSARAP
jgi:hypothetical protein